ncbi:MAG TPA: aldo/keto reductase [Microscillaceae bacterium]|nr:aldo/keto reductase [Microscillaceae bacterium]
MRYKLFGRSGLRVSELCLGTMTFGTEWGTGADYDTSKQVFDAYAKAGGNFLDTANRYTEGTSEKFVGEFIHSDRDHFVLATKYTLYDRQNDPNFSGNHRKNMMRSVEASLKRLNTEYIDLLWLHAWDFSTPIDEIMRGLDDLVSSGKVHYIGISDTPAWIVSQANTIAEFRGWSRFVGLQIEYSLIQRTPERDLMPMAKALDLAVTPWAPLAGGALTGKYLKNKDEEGRVKEGSARRNERSTKIAEAVVKVADELGVSPAQVAVRWTMQQDQTVIPIAGARKPSQIEDSLGCVDIVIPEAQMNMLNEVSAIELGFPHDFLRQDAVKHVVFGDTYGQIDF